MFGRFRRKINQAPICSVVVPAAGSSTRMEGQDKMLLMLGDLPVLARTLRALEECVAIDEVVVVTRSDLMVSVSRLCKDFGCDKVSQVVAGGETRTQSVLAGVRAVRADAALIAVHDGARPFVTGSLVEEVIRKAADCGAAAPAVPVKDTVKRAHDGLVVETLSREELFSVQTPQVFEASLLKAALQKAVDENAAITDDCSAVERLGMSVALTRGSEENIKITTPADVNLGLGILKSRGGFL